jgi:hypothetical protein
MGLTSSAAFGIRVGVRAWKRGVVLDLKIRICELVGSEVDQNAEESGMVVSFDGAAGVNPVIARALSPRIIGPVMGFRTNTDTDKCDKVFIGVIVTASLTLSACSRYLAPGRTALKIVNSSDSRSYLPSEPRILLVPSPHPREIFYLIFQNSSL